MIYKVVNNVWTFCFVWLIFRQKLQFLVYFLMEIRKVILRLKGKLYRQIFYTIKEEKQRSVITTTSGHSALLFGRWWSFDPQMASIKGNFNFIIPSIPRLFFSFVSVFFLCVHILSFIIKFITILPSIMITVHNLDCRHLQPSIFLSFFY